MNRNNWFRVIILAVFVAGCAKVHTVPQSVVTGGATIGRSTQLYINFNSYKVNQDFYPLAFSSNGIVTGYIARVGHGIYAPIVGFNDYSGQTNLSKKIFIIKSGNPPGKDAAVRFAPYDLKQRSEMAILRGASAVIFINSDSLTADPQADFNQAFRQGNIPVIFAKGGAAKILKEGLVTNCTVGVEIVPAEKANQKKK